MSERRSDRTLLKLDAVEFRSAMLKLKHDDPVRAERLRLERRRMRNRQYEERDPERVREMKRAAWHRLASAEYLAEKARRERERYTAMKETT